MLMADCASCPGLPGRHLVVHSNEKAPAGARAFPKCVRDLLAAEVSGDQREGSDVASVSELVITDVQYPGSIRNIADECR